MGVASLSRRGLSGDWMAWVVAWGSRDSSRPVKNLYNRTNVFTLLPCVTKTRNPLKLAGVPQTTGPISAVSGPMFTILCGHLEGILLLNKLFPIVDTFLYCEDIARQSCAMVPRWRFLATFFGSCIFREPRATHLRPTF